MKICVHSFGYVKIGIIATVFLGATMHVFASTFPAYSAEALKRFHAEQNRQIFELLPIQQDVLTELFASESKINHFERIYDRVEASIEQTLDQKIIATNAKHTLENAIIESRKHLETWEQIAEESKKEIAEINQELLRISQSIDAIEEKIQSNKENIKQYIVQNYTHNQNLYNHEEEGVHILRVLFQNTDHIASEVMQQNTSKILSHAGHAMLAKNKDYIHTQYELQKQITDLKDRKLVHKFRIKELTKNTQINLAYQNKLSEIATKKQAVLNQNHLKNKELEQAVQKEVEILKEAYEEKIQNIRALNDCEDTSNEMCLYVDAYYLAEKKLRDEYLGREAASFVWPVDISKGFSATFRDREYFQILGAAHHGVDIRIAQGTDIIAPEDGYVLYLNAPAPNTYSYLALKHPDGYVTVYGHLSEISVHRFDFVHAGDVIGKTGGAQGTPGAGTISSGPHLHFEMYHEKESVDPMRVISLAELPEEQLPKKYRYKYYLDLKEAGKSANPKTLKKSIQLLYFEGDNEIERQQYFIRKYASRDFGIWENWVRSAIAGNIDPSMVMCIGFAESGLGNNLTTGYNVGNVGNTDSGARRELTSATEGIQTIVWTLNGRFLGNHDYMSQLSGWGNPSGTIYASSTKNWHENMVNCLSALKDTFVSDDFTFRISDEEIETYKQALRKEG